MSSVCCQCGIPCVFVLFIAGVCCVVVVACFVLLLLVFLLFFVVVVCFFFLGGVFLRGFFNLNFLFVALLCFVCCFFVCVYVCFNSNIEIKLYIHTHTHARARIQTKVIANLRLTRVRTIMGRALSRWFEITIAHTYLQALRETEN